MPDTDPSAKPRSPREPFPLEAIGLVAGPVLAAIAFALLPVQYAGADGGVVDFPPAGRAALAMMVWMAVWWLTEAVPIAATALLPIAAFPLLGIAPLREATAPYASDVIFLFLGGFILAGAIQRWGLDRRIAFLTLRLVGTRPDAVTGGLMAATAFVSMWVSNTATAAMMVPIALSVIDLVLVRRGGRTLAEHGGIPSEHEGVRRFAMGLLLCIAYAASIGGIGTLVGSPPNGIAARFITQTFGREVSFLDWMVLGLPVVLVFLPLGWWLVTRVLFASGLGEIEGGREWVARELRALGPLGRGERLTLVVFAVTVALWITRPLLADLVVAGAKPFAALSDSGIAITAALALFVLPGDRGRARLADWSVARAVPWDVLILFGGGLSLAAAVEARGVAGYFGSLAVGFSGLPPLLVLLAVIALTTFLSELTSNTAQVATMVPLLAAIGPAVGVSPEVLVVACALAASAAFMMPVGTPPNAIVFGTGLLTIGQMARAGFWMNLVGIAVNTAAAFLLVGPLLARGA